MATSSSDPTRRREARAAMLFILPAGTMFLICTLLPVVAVACFMFLYIDRLGGTVEFVGFDDIACVLSGPRFLRAF